MKKLWTARNLTIALLLVMSFLAVVFVSTSKWSRMDSQTEVTNVTGNASLPLRGMGSPVPLFNCDASVNGLHYTDLAAGGAGQWLWACIGGTWTNATTVAALDSIATQTTLNCGGAGHVTFSEPEQGSSYKVVVANAVGCIGSATYTFPVAFVGVPAVSQTLSSPTTFSYTATTLTVGGSSVTAEYVLSGF